MDIFEYFESLRRGIQQNHTIGFLEAPVLMQAFDDYRGLFRARVFFWDSSHLTIDEIVDTTQGYPEILRYSYVYVKNDANIFRYDNAPHHSELATFPHHKHVGPTELSEVAEQPTLNQVFKQIEQILTSE